MPTEYEEYLDGLSRERKKSEPKKRPDAKLSFTPQQFSEAAIKREAEQAIASSRKTWKLDTEREDLTSDDVGNLLRERGWDGLPQTARNPEVYGEVARYANRSAIVAAGVKLQNMDIDQTWNDRGKNAGITGRYTPSTDRVALPGRPDLGTFNPVVAAHEFAHRGFQQLAAAAKERLKDKNLSSSEYLTAMSVRMMALDRDREERLTRLIEQDVTGKAPDSLTAQHFRLDDPGEAAGLRKELDLIEKFAQQELARRRPGGPR